MKFYTEDKKEWYSTSIKRNKAQNF